MTTTTTATETHDVNQAACRKTLARMAHSKPVPAKTVPAAVRRALVERGLVHEHTHRMVTPTPRAAGYCADPSTFEL